MNIEDLRLRIYATRTPGHTHLRVFARMGEGDTFARGGVLCFRNEEWDRIEVALRRANGQGIQVDVREEDAAAAAIVQAMNAVPLERQNERGEEIYPHALISQYDKIPEHLMESLVAYVNDGRPTGGCLEALLSNDLTEVMRRADEATMFAIPRVVGWLYNKAPMGCWGSKKNVALWIRAKAALREALEVEREADELVQRIAETDEDA
jgi:hypothetical protein